MANNTSLIQLKGSLFTITILRLLHNRVDTFAHELAQLVQQSPKFFQFAPVILDLHAIRHDNTPLDFSAIIAQLREYNIIPIGIRHGSPEHQRAIRELGLAVFPDDKSAATTETSNQANPETEAAVSSSTSASHTRNKNTTKIITQPVRSGQQIYARGGDLIITSSVSPGAEVLADGSIHVYGSLRGRALAGINGDESARIFCKYIEAELVSIAGHYLVNEEALQQANTGITQIYLEDDRLQISEL
ncbi:MAG: septum site-determining protein MinC [Gammaproteobacteria bacterium]